MLARSGLSKSALCARAGISRSTLDEYLKGQKQPSFAQVGRLADAAGLRLHAVTRPKPSPISAEYIAVMKTASQLAGTLDRLPPLRFPHEIWKRST